MGNVLFLVLVFQAWFSSSQVASLERQCGDTEGAVYLQKQFNFERMVTETQDPTCAKDGACCFVGQDAGMNQHVTMDNTSTEGCGDICCDSLGGAACFPIAEATARSLYCRGPKACGFNNPPWPRSRAVIFGTVTCIGTTTTCEKLLLTFQGAPAKKCMTCEGDGTCRGVKISWTDAAEGYCLDLQCYSVDDGSDTCAFMNVTGPGDILCQGEDACESMVLQGPIHLTCDGQSACNSITLETGDCSCVQRNGAACPSECTDVTDEGLEPLCPGTCPQAACCTASGSAAVDCKQCCSGGGTGDPHLRTLDGQHYTLLEEGTFLLLSLGGFQTQPPSVKYPDMLKTMPVDFKIFAHYAGRQSFTQALLVVDNSGNGHQALEMTSQHCLWRSGNGSTWSAEKKELNVLDHEGDTITSMKLLKRAKGEQEKREEKKKMQLLGEKIQFLVKSQEGLQKMAELFVRCKPGKHLNVKIKLTPAALRHVNGELAPGRGGLHRDSKHAMSLVSVDQEFRQTKLWTELGGSTEAAEYLEDVDGDGDGTGRGGNPVVLKSCTLEETNAAEELCKKYLGEAAPSASRASLRIPTPSADSFADCVFDVCQGGGEAAAELAAEILHAE